MATIEERAKNSIDENAGWNDTFMANVEFGYVLGAEYQKKIDIQKLKDVMNILMIDTKVKAEIIKLMNDE